MNTSRLRDILYALTTPSCWVRNSPCSMELTRHIDSCLVSGERLSLITECTMELGGVRLWRENYPYAYGSLERGPAGATRFLPSRACAKRLRDAECALEQGNPVERAIRQQRRASNG